MPLVHIARLGRAIGLDGLISLNLLTDRPEELLGNTGEYPLLDGRKVRVKELIERGGKWFWLLDSGSPAIARNYAETFVNGVVVAESSTLPPRGDGEFSEFEIAGMEVLDESGALIGVVERVDARHGFEAWIIRDTSGKERELPALRQFVIEVDRAARKIRVHADGVL